MDDAIGGSKTASAEFSADSQIVMFSSFSLKAGEKIKFKVESDDAEWGLLRLFTGTWAANAICMQYGTQTNIEIEKNVIYEGSFLIDANDLRLRLNNIVSGGTIKLTVYLEGKLDEIQTQIVSLNNELDEAEKDISELDGRVDVLEGENVIENYLVNGVITIETTTTTVVASLKANVEYTLYAKSDVTFVSGKCGWYKDSDATPFHSLEDTLSTGDTYKYTPDSDVTLRIRTGVAGSEIEVKVYSYTEIKEAVKELQTTSKEHSEDIETISKDIETLKTLNHWEGKNVVVYGDSITAIGNGDDNECTGSYMWYAYNNHRFQHLYVRGIGGQTYMWNTNGWYTVVGTNGKYKDRYNYDASGNKLSTVVSPETTTETEKGYIESVIGQTIEIHYGAFCSWDRITSMIPSSIRESIDLVILCGGHNDFSAVEEVEVEGEIKIEEPKWKSGDTTDPTWAADATYYAGGDYDITTFGGAMASTIMKMQIWCPNAVVIVATPFPRFDLTTKQQFVNEHDLTFRELCDIEIGVAGFVSTDVIDSNGKCNINGINFANYQTDGVHPNAEGRKLFGRVLDGELLRIHPKE